MSVSPTQDGSAIQSADPPAPEHPVLTPWLAPVSAGLLYLAFWQIVPRVRTESEGAVIVSTLFSLGLIVWFTASLARSAYSLKAIFIGLLATGALVLPLKVMVWKMKLFPPWSWLIYIPGLADLLFIMFAATFGCILSRLLRTANMIPPVAAMLALVDTWTVLFGGPVQTMMQSKNPVAQAVSHAMTVPMPALQRGAAPFRPSSIVGFADFVFIAFFVSALCRLINVQGAYRKTVRALILVLCLYMLAIHLPEWNLPPLPALVPMAVVMIGLHWRNFKYERSEAFALLYAAIVVVALVAGFWFFRGRKQPEAEPPRAMLPARHNTELAS